MQLGEGRFRGQIKPRHHTDLIQQGTRCIGSLTDRSLLALGHIHHHLPAPSCMRQHLQQTGLGFRRVTNAIGEQYHSLYRFRRQRLLQQPQRHARICHQHDHCIRIIRGYFKAHGLWRQSLYTQLNVNAGLTQPRGIRRIKCIQAAAFYLAAAIAAQQTTIETDAHLSKIRTRRQQQRRNQIIQRIISHLAERNLGTGQNHRLVQLRQHE